MAGLFLSLRDGAVRRRLAAAGLTLLLAGCESLLFFPMRPLVRTPDQVGLEYRDVRLRAQDGIQLHGWWLPASVEAQASVLFVHGNAENISTHLASVYWLPAAGVNVLLLDYRGYGQSEGSPSVGGALNDVQAALDYLSHSSDSSGLPVVVLGQSLGASLAGAAVAQGGSDSCQRRQRWPGLQGVVLDAGFSRYNEIARDVASRNLLTYLLQWPVAWAMPDGMDLIDAVAELDSLPKLFIYGEQDPVVSPQHAQNLYAAAAQPKALWHYAGGHIDTFSRPVGRQRLLQFIAEAAHYPPPEC